MNAKTGFRYVVSDEERAAADLLSEKGWKVQEPRCPECNGWGHRTLFKAVEDYVVGEGLTYTIPCPRGCPELDLGAALGSSTRGDRG